MTSSHTSNRCKALLVTVFVEGLVCAATSRAGPFSPFAPFSPPVYTVWRTVGTHEGLPHDSIRALRMVGEQLWVGTDGGLARLDGGEWKAWSAADGLPPYPVSAIDIDLETRDLWLGTWGGGLVRFTAGRADIFNQFNSGLAGDLVFDVVVVDGRVWAATNGGLCVFDPQADSWELFHPRRASGRETAVTELLYDRGNLYAVLWKEGVGDQRSMIKVQGSKNGTHRVCSSFSNFELRTLTFSPPTPDPRSLIPDRRTGPARTSVQCLALAPGGKLWVGTHVGLHMLADGAQNQWISYRADDQGRRGVITMTLGDKKTTEIRHLPVIPDKNVRCIAFDRSGVWVGTARGLAHGSQSIPWSEVNASSPERTAIHRPDGLREGGLSPQASSPAQSSVPPEPLSIAVYGPRNRTIKLPGQARRLDRASGETDLVAVELAVELAPPPTGKQSVRPIELKYVKPGYSRYGWGLPEDDMIEFAQDPRVLGIVGAIDAEQLITDAAAARTEIPWMNFAPNDDPGDARVGGLGESSNPWVFRCWGDWPRQHRLLLDHVFDELGCSRPAVLRTPGGGLHLDWWADHARLRGRPVVADVAWDPDATDRETIWETLRRANADAVLTWCDKETAGGILRSMRQAGLRQWFVGGPAIAAEDFTTVVGSDPGPVLALIPKERPTVDPSDAGFSRQYVARSTARGVAVRPDARALRAWDATDHLIDALRRSAPDRPAVRRTLEESSRSAWGEIHYERLHKRGTATVAHLQDGRWIMRTVFDSSGD